MVSFVVAIGLVNPRNCLPARLRTWRAKAASSAGGSGRALNPSATRKAAICYEVDAGMRECGCNKLCI